MRIPRRAALALGGLALRRVSDGAVRRGCDIARRRPLCHGVFLHGGARLHSPGLFTTGACEEGACFGMVTMLSQRPTKEACLPDSATPPFRFHTLAPLALGAAFAGGWLTCDDGLPWLAHGDAEIGVCAEIAAHVPAWRRGIATVHVLADTMNAALGFSTLSNFSVIAADLPAQAGKSLPDRIPLPAHLIGQPAVEARQQGTGSGGILLRDALRRAHRTVARSVSVAVGVHASDAAAAWHARYGFVPLPAHPRHLLMPVKDIARLS